MSLSLTITRSVPLTAGRPVTLAALRLLGLPSVSISGSVGTGDIASGAITPALASPGAYFYGATSGTNAYSVTLSPALTGLANGVQVWVKIGATNTSAAAPTIDVNTLGAKPIYHRSGIVPQAGDLQQNDIVELTYNTSRNSGNGGWDLGFKVQGDIIRFGTSTGSANAYIFTSSNLPVASALAGLVGQILVMKASFSNTGAATLNVDTLGAIAIVKRNGAALITDDLISGEYFAVTYDLSANKFYLVNQRTPIAIVAASRNLIIKNNNSTPNSKLDISADEVILKSSDGQVMIARSVSVTADITLGTALNGLETGGTESASHWYYVYLISDGTNVRCVLKDAGADLGAAPSAPDLSNAVFTGYNYTALIGQVRNDGSSNFRVMYQRDRKVWMPTTVIASQITGVTAWTAIAGTLQTALETVIPPNATLCWGSGGNTGAGRGLYFAGDSSGTSAILIHGTNSATTLDTTFDLAGYFAVPLQAPCVFYYKMGNTTVTCYGFNVSGYEF